MRKYWSTLCCGWLFLGLLGRFLTYLYSSPPNIYVIAYCVPCGSATKAKIQRSRENILAVKGVWAFACFFYTDYWRLYAKISQRHTEAAANGRRFGHYLMFLNVSKAEAHVDFLTAVVS